MNPKKWNWKLLIAQFIILGLGGNIEGFSYRDGFILCGVLEIWSAFYKLLTEIRDRLPLPQVISSGNVSGERINIKD